MKYLQEERFIVNSNDKQSLKNYADNYDRIFGEPEPCRKRPGTEDIAHTDDCDGIECKVKLYANLIVPPEAQIGPLEKVCTGYYDDGIGPTACENREGCGLPGCPANDFGFTPNPSVDPGVCPHCGRKLDEHGICPDL